MDGETPETLGYRGAQYVRADVVEGRVREALGANGPIWKAIALWRIARDGKPAGQAAKKVDATIIWAIRQVTRPALASPSDSSGDDEGGTKG